MSKPSCPIKVQVRCKKSDGQRITHLGGINHAKSDRWMLSEAEVVNLIKSGVEFYTDQLLGGVVASVLIIEGGTLRTSPDGLHGNNLAALPDCPDGC